MNKPDSAQRHADLVRPFFLGVDGEGLYACHHLPARGRAVRGAVVLCQPVGNEYFYSHQAIRQLATRLARQGFHALRFDYFGTGDSAGEENEATMARWHVDVSIALDQAKELAKCETLAVVGLRLGATLCWEVAQSRGDVSRLVLWEPILEGRALLDEWKRKQDAFWQSLGYPTDAKLKETMGIELSDALLTGIASTRLSFRPDVNSQALILVNRPSPATRDFANLLTGSGHQVQFQEIADSLVWQENALQSLVPTASLDTLIAWLEAGHD